VRRSSEGTVSAVAAALVLAAMLLFGLSAALSVPLWFVVLGVFAFIVGIALLLATE
jgi:uncharacterized membrane protein YvlD (DUF360 family)